MSQICRTCGPERLYPDDEVVCPIHTFDLEPYADPEPDPGEPAFPEPRVAEVRSTACWNCGTEPPPDAGNIECLHCHRPLEPPAMVIRFEGGRVEVRRGERVELGRLGRFARLFRSYANVSRRHAVIGAEPDGTVWIEPGPTPNGTFLDGHELRTANRVRLSNNQHVRLALHAEGIVTIFPRPGDAR